MGGSSGCTIFFFRKCFFFCKTVYLRVRKESLRNSRKLFFIKKKKKKKKVENLSSPFSDIRFHFVCVCVGGGVQIYSEAKESIHFLEVCNLLIFHCSGLKFCKIYFYSR